jgi:hypothetical protein
MKRVLLVTSFALLSLLTACGGNAPLTPTPDINAIYTTAAMTVVAELTQAAAMNTATPQATATAPPSLPSKTAVPTSAETSTPQVTNTPTPSPTSTATNTPQAQATSEFCDNAAFVADISVPDKTEMTPGQNFEKTWLIKNTGTCTWVEGYHLVFGYDEKMNGQPRPLSSVVQPGETVEMTVVLTAPTTAGEYRSYWRMANTEGINFGDFFFVYIVVR